MGIVENLQKILSSRYGRDVRQAIHDAIHECYEDGKAGAIDLVAREEIEAVREDIKDYDIFNSISTTHSLDTQKGGIRLNKIVGKSHKSSNLLNPILETTTLNGVTCTNNGDGTYTLNGTASANTLFYVSSYNFDGKTYKYLGVPPNANFSSYIDSWGIDHGNGLIIKNSGENNIRLYISNGTILSNAVFKPMLIDLTEHPELEGVTYDDFEPYGIFSSGEMGLVDLGSLGWIYNGGSGSEKAYTATVPELPNVTNTDNKTRCFCNELICGSANEIISKWIDNSIAVISSNRLYIVTKHADATSLKNAMKGVLLAYELADGATPSQYAEVVEEQGKNVWNESWEVGRYNIAINKGEKVADSTRIRNTIPISVKPNTSYYIVFPSGIDIDFNYAILNENGVSITSSLFLRNSGVISTPDNAKSLVFYIGSGYGSTYHNDIAIIEGTSGAYVPYQSNTVFFPLAEPLRSVGDGFEDVIDCKPKTYHNMKSVDLSTLNWIVRDWGNGKSFQAQIGDSKTISANIIANALCTTYKVVSADTTYSHSEDKILSIHDVGGFAIVNDSSCTTVSELVNKLRGTMLYYEAVSGGTDYEAVLRTNKVVCVDLGSLDWTYNGTIFISSFSGHKRGSYLYADDWLICEKYPSIPAKDVTLYERGICFTNDSDNLYVRDTSFTDPSTFKQAMQGVKLICELAEPTTLLAFDDRTPIYQLESYKDKTYIDTADQYAKATLDLDYGKGEVASTTLANENRSYINSIKMEKYLAELEELRTAFISQ